MKSSKINSKIKLNKYLFDCVLWRGKKFAKLFMKIRFLPQSFLAAQMDKKTIIEFDKEVFSPVVFWAYNTPIHSFIDTSNRDGINLYFSLKEKYEYELLNEEEFWRVFRTFVPVFNADCCFYIDSNKLLSQVLSEQIFGAASKLKKSKKQSIINKAKKLIWSKEEWASQIRKFEKMGDSFEINKIKTNQRHKYSKYLFASIRKNIEGKRILLVDDSLFSGATLQSAIEKIQEYNPKSIQVMTLFFCKSLIGEIK